MWYTIWQIMSVKKIFWEDPYLVETNARITSVSGSDVTLDRTILYAFSGGQESDSGAINGFPVISAKKDKFEIIYTLPENHPLKTGDEVKLTLDWDKRYRLMRLHFAAELVLEIVNQNYNRLEKIGANITSEKARIDFTYADNISAILPDVNDKLEDLINRNLEITSSFSDEANERRTWEIKDFAKVHCGGTHIKRTGEIGKTLLKRKNTGKNKERIEIYLMD
jgi:Ser-tRNA(Ala) deacylase AlaX